MQPCPGVYNASLVDAFDRALYELGKRNSATRVFASGS